MESIISLKYKILRRASKIVYRYNYNKGISICDEQWDNLIILDACRYDLFEKEYYEERLEGDLEYRISKGSCTPEFLKSNFEGKKCKDIIYVTGNPYVNKFFKDNFFKIIPVWDLGWNDKYNTVLPEDMYKYTLYTLKKYPEKRLIIHFMQPHSPFLTDPIIGDTGIKYLRKSLLGKDLASKEITAWSIIEREKIDTKRVWKAYAQNLYLVMPYVKKLLKIMRGINVVTADHGNAVGDIFSPIFPVRVYGHPCRIHMDILVKVPWLIYENKISKEEMLLRIEQEIIHDKVKRFKKFV